MNKICGIYKITNTITGDFYIGSSKNVKRRLAAHKWPSRWNDNPNNPLYLDMKKYGVDKFVFEILAEVEIDSLKEMEQQFIETLKPTYNNRNANGWDVERKKEWDKENYNKHREEMLEQRKQYRNQLCLFNDETLTLCALVQRFKRRGLSNPTAEAKKYLLNKSKGK